MVFNNISFCFDFGLDFIKGEVVEIVKVVVYLCIFILLIVGNFFVVVFILRDCCL